MSGAALVGGGLLAVAALIAPLHVAHAQGPLAPVPGADSPEATVGGDTAGRLYLSQALASLGRAERYAQLARQYGQPKAFDLDRFVAELGTVRGGLQRYLVPAAPPPGAAAEVEITGEYLWQGLRQAPGKE